MLIYLFCLHALSADADEIDYNLEHCTIVMCKKVCFLQNSKNKTFKITKVTKSDFFCSAEIKNRLVIPNYTEIDNEFYQINEIGSKSFENTRLTDIKFVGKITKVDNGAFQNNNFLKSVDLSKTRITAIPDNCFLNTPQLKYILLPETVVHFGKYCFSNTGIEKYLANSTNIIFNDGAFAYSSFLEYVDLQILNISKLPNRIFSNCIKLEKILLPPTIKVIGDASFQATSITSFNFQNITQIFSNAFSYCKKLDSIDLSDTNITFLNRSIFYGCSNLKTIKFPPKLKNISDNVFSQTCLSEITLPSSVKFIGEALFSNVSTLIKADFSKLKTQEIPDFTFFNCIKLKMFSISPYTKTIGRSAFCNSGLEFLNLTNTNIEEIKENAFSFCSRLISVDLPSNIRYLRNWTFSNSNLNSTVDLRLTNITVIPHYCFFMTNISEILLPDKLLEIGEFSFASTSLSTIKFPRNLISIDSGAFFNCINLNNIKMSETSIKIISKQVFMNTISLISLEMPETVEIIEKESFKFSSIKKIKFPKNLQSIEDSAFCNCSKLTEISFNKTNITFIGDFAFKNCINLQNVYFSNNLRFLGQETFSNTKIVRLELVGLRNVSTGAFMNNEYLVFCDFTGTFLEVFPQNLFKNCPNLSTIYYPHNLQFIEKSCFERTGLHYTILPSSILRVKSMSFSFCQKLKFVELEHTKMKTIPKMMFFKCSVLERITFPQNLTSIKEFSLSFTNLRYLTFPDGLQIVRNGLIDIHNLEVVNLSNTQIFCFESRMFMNCFSLERIFLPLFLEEIQEFVFDGTKIKKLVVPFGCKLLPFVFANSSLETIDLSNSNLTEILPNVFSDTLHLKNLILPKSLVACSENAFNSSNIPELVFTGLQTIESNSLFCPLLKKIDFSKTNLTILPSFIFSKCPVLKEIILSETLQSIGSNSFHGTQLKEIICPRSLIEIEEEGFMNAIYLEKLDLSKCQILTLQPRAFYNCMKLTEIKWPQHLDTIQKSCFANSGLKNVTFPKTVTSIGESTFYQCLFLEKVDFSSCQITFIPKNCFFNCKSLKCVKFANLKYKLTNYAFSTTAITVLTMPELELDSGLFIQRCRTIEYLDLSKTKICRFAKHFFSDCVKLRVLILPPTAEYFSVSAFSNCVSLEKIFYCGRSTFSNDIEIPSNSEIEFYVSDIYPNSQIFGISVIRTTKCSEFNVSNIE